METTTDTKCQSYKRRHPHDEGQWSWPLMVSRLCNVTWRQERIVPTVTPAPLATYLRLPGPGRGRAGVEAGARRGQRPSSAHGRCWSSARAASHDLVWPCHGLPVLPVLPHCHSLPIRHELTPGSCSPTVQGRGHHSVVSQVG